MKREQIVSKWEFLTNRERDAWVAEVVFGWVRCEPVEGKSFILPPPEDERCNWAAMFEDGIPHYLPRYSEDIAAAWTIVSELRSDGALVDISDINTSGWHVDVINGDVASASAYTVEKAICLAGIIAKLTETV